jgi:hypothetical protein
MSQKYWDSCSSFFYSTGVIHKEFVPPGQTVNQTFYLQVLWRLRNRVVHVCCEIANTWFLHHNYAPSHTSIAVKEFLAQNNITMLPHPPYSPDLAPWDFFLFPKLKTHLKGHHFGLKTSRQLRRGLWTTSQVKTSSTAMKTGSNAGIAVFDHKEPSLKWINCSCMYVQYFLKSFSLLLGQTSYTFKYIFS